MSQAYVHELFLSGLTIEEFTDVMRVYGQYVTDAWYAERLHGVKLANVPLIALDGLSSVVANAAQVSRGHGVPDDQASSILDGPIDPQGLSQH